MGDSVVIRQEDSLLRYSLELRELVDSCEILVDRIMS